MSGYTSGNKAPTLMAQMPNRVGNVGKLSPSHSTGVTAVTGSMGGTAFAAGSQGAPSYAKATDNTAGGATGGRKQKVQVSMPKEYVCHSTNTGYMSSGRNSWEK
jgi:hypothetical protein